MDTITHGIVGALAGKALFAGRDVAARPVPDRSVPARSVADTLSHAQSSSIARAAIVGCTIGSVFPDIDIFAGPLAGNPLGIMEWHRNITHSIVILPLWALLLAAASLPLARWLRWDRPSFPKMFVIFAVGLATHVFLDVVTDFGTMVWSPLGYSRVAWDWVFILDLTLTALALVPQIVAWCYREPQKFERRAAICWAALTVGVFGAYALAATAGYGFSLGVVGVVSVILALVLFLPAVRAAGFEWTRATWCRVGLAVVCVYLAGASVMHRKALADVNDFAAAHHLVDQGRVSDDSRVADQRRAALPLPPSFTHWAGLISTPEGVWRITFREPGGAVERTHFYSDGQSSPYVQEAKKLRDVQVYLWFARFPIWQIGRQGEKTIVDISDVRFFREEDPRGNIESQLMLRSGIRPNAAAGFTFEIVFDATGQVVSSGFKKPER